MGSLTTNFATDLLPVAFIYLPIGHKRQRQDFLWMRWPHLEFKSGSLQSDLCIPFVATPELPQMSERNVAFHHVNLQRYSSRGPILNRRPGIMKLFVDHSVSRDLLCSIPSALLRTWSARTSSTRALESLVFCCKLAADLKAFRLLLVPERCVDYSLKSSSTQSASSLAPTQARANAVIKPPRWLGRNWNVSFLISGFTFLTVAILGVGFGGYASIHTLIDQISTFGVFDDCYQCPAPAKPKRF